MFSLLSWEKASKGFVPLGSIKCGKDFGQSHFVGRIAKSDEEIIPGKVFQSHGVFYYSQDGREVSSDHYEVLRAPAGHQWKDFVHWVSYRKGDALPAGAIPGGIANGKTLYIGLGPINGGANIVPGFVEGSNRCWELHVPWGGKDHVVKNFEVLADVSGDSLMSECSPSSDRSSKSFGFSNLFPQQLLLSDGASGANSSEEKYSEDEEDVIDEFDRTG